MKVKTLLIVVGLLAAVSLANKYIIKMDPEQLVERGVGKDAHSHGHDHGDEEGKPGEEDLRQPLGPEGAPVLVQVLATGITELEMPLRPMMTALSQTYPDHVRIEFPATDSEEFKKLVEQAHGMPTGLIINGEMIKEVPEAKLGFVTFQGTPTMEDWTEQDLRLVVEHELEKAGVEFTPTVQHAHEAAGGGGGEGHSHAGHNH